MDTPQIQGLSVKAKKTLATTFAQDVVSYIYCDEGFMDYLMEVIPEAMDKFIGHIEDVSDRIEVAQMILERVRLSAVSG